MKTKYLVARRCEEFAGEAFDEYLTHNGKGSTNEMSEAQRFTMAQALKWINANVLAGDLKNWHIIPL